MQSAAAFCDMVTAHLPSQFETGFPSSHIIETRPVKSVCVSRAMPCKHAMQPQACMEAGICGSSRFGFDHISF